MTPFDLINAVWVTILACIFLAGIVAKVFGRDKEGDRLIVAGAILVAITILLSVIGYVWWYVLTRGV